VKALEPMRIPLAGVALIEASAGTGKTYTVETLYLRLLLERRLGVERILVVTYTNAAAAELRGRIRDRIAVARRVLEGGADDERGEWVDWLRARRGGHGDEDRVALLRAVYYLDQAAIFTIHAFCQRVLQDLAFQSGAAYGTELISDQTAMLDEVVRDFWVRELHDAPPEVVSLLGKELKQLRGLARIAASQPDLAFVPPAGAVTAVTELFAVWRESRDVAARLLAAERDRVVELVVRARTVRAASARPWTDDLAVALASPTPYVGKSFKYLDRFSARAAANVGVLPAHPFFDACADLCEREEELRAALAERRLQLRHRLVDFVRRELRRRKEEDNVAYFDDLLQSVAAALCGGRGEALAAELRQRYPTALIDEFQDTDPAQYEIFSRIYGAPAGAEAPALFLVGDPKQAIYGFRGADVFAYTRAKASLAGETTSLPVNRRSTRPLIAAVNEVFSRAARGGHSAFLVAGIEFEAVRAGDAPPPELRVPGWGALTFLHHPHGGKRRLAKEEARKLIYDGVVAEVARLLAARPVLQNGELAPHDVAVLCRTNLEARMLQEKFRASGIPTVLQGDSSVFESPEAEEMQRVLRAMAEPRSAAAVRAALATSILGCDASRIYALQADGEALGDPTGGLDWLAAFRDWHAQWGRHGFMPAFRRMLEESGAPATLLSLPDGERRLTNVLHLAELLQAAGHEERRGPLALVEWLGLMRDDATRRGEFAGESAQIRLERDAAALVLTTVHKSKGLQYPVVFCPFLWDGRLPKDDEPQAFHDPERGGRRSLDLAPETGAHRERARLEALAENMRLLYVALTRAESACAVVWGRFSGYETSALGYVLHAPADLGDDVVQRLEDHISDSTDADLLRDLQALRQAAPPGAIEIAPLGAEPAPRYRPERETDPASLRARTVTRAAFEAWRVSSFSALVAERSELSDAAREGLDRDELAPAEVADAAEQRRIRLADLPAGTRTGLMIHKIFELIDFVEVGGATQQQIIERQVAAYGLERRWGEVLGAAFSDIVDTPLPAAAGRFRLRDVARRRRLDEMEFVFPVGAPDRQCDAAALADVLAHHGAPHGAPEYAGRLRQLGFAAFAGFLRGYIDCVFEHAGRWYVVDYKSNQLGVTGAAYAPERLRAEMVSSHYFLQYHLYVVAAHRHLATRLPGYDFDRHFGGVFYLFLRGMSPEHAEPWGVFYDRPSRALVEELSALLSPAVAEVGR